jgi:hypothetical protein
MVSELQVVQELCHRVYTTHSGHLEAVYLPHSSNHCHAIFSVKELTSLPPDVTPRYFLKIFFFFAVWENSYKAKYKWKFDKKFRILYSVTFLQFFHIYHIMNWLIFSLLVTTIVELYITSLEVCKFCICKQLLIVTYFTL